MKNYLAGKKITATSLNAAQEPRNLPRKRYDVTDSGHKGLRVRVHPSGVITFRFRYTHAGKRDVMVLGEYGKAGITLDEARELRMAAQRLLEADPPRDPKEERARREREAEIKRAERAEAGTVADLVEQFVHRKLKGERWDQERQQWVRDPKNKTKTRKRPDDAAALLKSNVVAKLGKEHSRDVTRRQLIKLLDDIVDRGAPVTANRVHALLKQLFEWAAGKDIIASAPMAGVKRPGGEEMPRERTLTEEEIRAFWAKVDTADMAEPTRLALKFLLVTAQRRGEITLAKWSHFDLDGGKLWTIPVELQKSSHARWKKKTPEPHAVPLSALALELLGKLQALTGQGVYVLPAHVDQKKIAPYSERVLSRAVRENEEHFGIAHFTPHDLRRTAASWMTKLGTPRLHVEKVLNHSTGDIAEIYDRHDYLPEKRAALERWGASLTDIIEGRARKIVPLQRPAQRQAAS